MAKVQRELAYFKKNSGIFPAEIIKTGQKPKARAQSQVDHLDVQDINKNKSVGLKQRNASMTAIPEATL